MAQQTSSSGLPSRIKGPVAVIGDVHGQLDKLEVVLEMLSQLPDYDRRWIVFIGDFVDRGPDSKAVLDRVVQLSQQRGGVTAVAGNHEFAMCAALGLIPTPAESNWHQRWVARYDAAATFAAYGVAVGDLHELRAQIPADHAQFLVNLPWCVEHPGYVFVHAGLDPHQPFDLQMRILRNKDFTLHRPQWLCSKEFVQPEVPADCGLTVVSGHEKVDEVSFYKQRILVDTTGGVAGDLSCVLLPENEVLTSAGTHRLAAKTGGRWWRKLTGARAATLPT